MTPENQTRARWLVLGLILAACVVGYGWARSSAIARGRIAAETAERQRAILHAETWRETAIAAQAKLEQLVPSLERELAAAKDAKAPVLVAGRTITERVPFEVPGRCATSPAPGRSVGEPAVVERNPAPVDVQADVQTALVGLADGSIDWTQRIAATVGWGEYGETCDPGEPCATKPLPAKAGGMSIDPAIAAAYRRRIEGLPWQADVRLGVTTEPGLRLGGTFYGKRRRTGLWVDVDAAQQRTSTYSPYTEATIYGQAVTFRGAAGIGWRLGPK